MKSKIIRLMALLVFIGNLCHAAYADTFQANFSDTPLPDFALAASKTLGKTIIFSTPLKGTVTLQSMTLSADEYYTLLLSVLRSNGYAVTEKDNTLTVMGSDKATSALGYLNDNEGRSDNDIVTRIRSLNHLTASDITATVESLMNESQDVSVTAVSSTDIVVITGFRDAVEKALTVIQKMDSLDTDIQERISLDYASAVPLSTEIQDLLRSNGQKDHIDITADSRTNSLVIKGAEDDISRLKALIAELDIPDESLTAEDSQNSNVIYLKYAQAKDVAEVIQKVLGADKTTPSRIVADEKVNALIISAYGDEQEKLEQLVRKLDIRRAQVHVEAMIVEIADADGVNFGVQWGSSDGSLVQFSNGTQLPLGALVGAAYQGKENKGSTVIDENGNTTVNPDTKGDLSTLLGLLSGYNGAAVSVVKGNWMALIQAIKTNTSANILSTPSLTTLDNQKASFMVGEEVPVITGSTTSANNTNPFQTVDRRNVGTKLTIQPQINSGNTVQLQLSAEVSKVEGNTGVDVVFAERKLDTTVLAENGSLIVLGGLIDEQEDTSHSSVPLLGEIPVIGKLFSSDNHSKQKRNLMIFLRPTILQTGDDSKALSSEKYQFIHDKEREYQNRTPAGTPVGNNAIPDDEVAAFRRVRVNG